MACKKKGQFKAISINLNVQNVKGMTHFVCFGRTCTVSIFCRVHVGNRFGACRQGWTRHNF